MRRLNALGIAGAFLLLASPAAAQQGQGEVEIDGQDGVEIRGQDDVHIHQDDDVRVRDPDRARDRDMWARDRAMRMERMRERTEPKSITQLGPLDEWGAALMIGGGVYDFIDSDTRDFTNLGGSWELRLLLGTERVVGFEAAYVGGAQDVDAIGLDDSAIWLASSAEGGIRIHLFNNTFAPYLYVGAAYKRYDLVNEDRNVSNVSSDEQVLELPGGAGFSLNFQPLFLDFRGTVRPALFDDGLIEGDGGQTSLHNWRASMRIGASF